MGSRPAGRAAPEGSHGRSAMQVYGISSNKVWTLAVLGGALLLGGRGPAAVPSPAPPDRAPASSTLRAPSTSLEAGVRASAETLLGSLPGLLSTRSLATDERRGGNDRGDRPALLRGARLQPVAPRHPRPPTPVPGRRRLSAGFVPDRSTAPPTVA